MRRMFHTQRPRAGKWGTPSQRKISLPAFESMSLSAAEAEQRLSLAWLRELLGASLPIELGQALDWQLWCWGQDIAGIPGNGLLQMQFERCPPPEGIKSSSCYRQTNWLPDGVPQRLALRGCGLFFGQGDSLGIVLPRYRFSPCLHSCELYPPLNWTCDRSLIVHAPQTATERQTMLALIVGLFERIASYEQDVDRLYGAAHRRDCRLKWKKTVPLPLADLAEGWRNFGREIGRHLAPSFDKHPSLTASESPVE